MDVIELDNTGEDRAEQREETERAEREDEETSFIEIMVIYTHMQHGGLFC